MLKWLNMHNKMCEVALLVFPFLIERISEIRYPFFIYRKKLIFRQFLFGNPYTLSGNAEKGEINNIETSKKMTF